MVADDNVEQIIKWGLAITFATPATPFEQGNQCWSICRTTKIWRLKKTRGVWLQLRQPIAIGNYCSPMLCKQPSFCTRRRSHFDIWVHIGSKWQPGEEWKGQGLDVQMTFLCSVAALVTIWTQTRHSFVSLETRPLEWKPYPPTTVCEKEFICSIPSLPPMLSPPPLALSVHICLGHLQLGRSCMHGARMIDF